MLRTGGGGRTCVLACSLACVHVCEGLRFAAASSSFSRLYSVHLLYL
jgi:hypothetical protein